MTTKYNTKKAERVFLSRESYLVGGGVVYGTRQDKTKTTRQDKTRQDKNYKTRQDKTRQKLQDKTKTTR